MKFYKPECTSRNLRSIRKYEFLFENLNLRKSFHFLTNIIKEHKKQRMERFKVFLMDYSNFKLKLGID